MSSLSIGLITSGGEENERLVALLESAGAKLKYQISPQAISQQQIEDEDLHVWLLNVDDDSWDDQLDLLLDQSEVPVYFNEPGTLSRQSHPDFWCENLIKRLIDLTGLAPEAFTGEKSETVAVPTTDSSLMSEPAAETAMHAAEAKSSAAISSTGLEKSRSENSAAKSASQLTEVLDELEDNSINLPADIANELVSELEDIAPELKHQPKPDLKPEPKVESKPEKQSFSLTETISPDEKLDFESNEINDSDIENIADDAFDFSVEEMALDLDEDEATEIDSEIAETSDNDVDTQIKQVADEILSMQAQEEPPSESPSVLENETLLDFPEDSELTLETHRENNDATLKASFESDEQSTEDEAETEATADDSDFDFELDDIALEDDSDIADDISVDEPDVENSVQVESKLTLADDSEALSTESAMPVKSSAELSDELEDISIDGLSLELEDTKEEKIVGKASFKIDESDVPADVADESNSGSISEASVEESVEDESEFSFSLESFDDEKPVSGRAQFKIDEGDDSLESSEPPMSSTEEPEAVTEDSLAEEKEEESLTLEALPEEQADWLATEESEQKEKIEPVVTEQIEETESTSVEEEISIDEMSFDFDLEEDSTSDSETSEQLSGNTESEIETTDARGEPENIDVQSGIEDDEFSFETTEEEDNIVEPTIDDSLLEETLIEETTIHETANNQPVIEESTITEPAIELPATEAVSAEDDGLEFDIPMLEEPAGDVNFETPTTDYFEAELLPCWILGASLGGPASLKQFLQKIPENINASFVIAQHIDESFLPVLAEILSTNSAFNVEVANGSNPMKPGTVLLAPLKGKIIFLRDGSLMVDRSQKWSEPYSPCIDDVIKAAAEVYGRQSGAIIFSGMGQDGLEGARIMKEKGGQVWAQQPETCANSSMPEAIINHALASYIAAPDGLATSLSGLLAGEKAAARS